MPDDIKPKEGFPNPREHNKEIAATLAAQGADRLSKPEDLVETGDALDKLLKAAEEKTSKPTEDTEAAAAKEVEIATEKEAIKEKTEVDAEKKAADDAVLQKTSEIFKDTPALPSGASPKSSEAFSAIKLKATQEISSRDAEIDKLKASIKEFEEKLKNPVPPALQKEIEDLRIFRARLDVETDPKFKEFDKTVNSSKEFIYAQLRKSPAVTDEVIAEIKKYGGPENVNLAKLFEKINDPTIQKLVEAKVADIEMAKFQKEQAVKTSKENIGQYLKEREDAWQKAAVGHNTATQAVLNDLISKIDWFKEQTIDLKLDDSAKKAVQEHNKFITDTRQQLEAALADDSPEMRAILLTGMVQLFNLQRLYPAEKSAHEKTRTELKEAQEKIQRLTNASASRVRESNAPPGGKLPEKKSDIDFNIHTTDALDKIAKQVMEERAAKAV